MLGGSASFKMLSSWSTKGLTLSSCLSSVRSEGERQPDGAFPCQQQDGGVRRHSTGQLAQGQTLAAAARPAE